MNDEVNWYSEDVATFGDRLAHAREERGLTQQDLAENIGVKKSTLLAWENNNREPRGNRLQMLSGILGVSLSWLITGVGEGLDESENAAPISLEISDLIAEMRSLRAQLERSGSKLEQLEKRLSAVV